MTGNLDGQLADERRSVSFDSYDITVKQLVGMVVDAEIEIAPEYQRSFVWDTERQSELIESVFLGIPVPSLFMATNSDSTWEVVDGLQRLTSLVNFIYPNSSLPNSSFTRLRIQGLSKLTSLNGLAYSELPQVNRLFFSNRPIKITVLNDLSDRKVRFDLFERLNTGGILLEEQEIRACVYHGPFSDFIRELAADERLNYLILGRKSGKSTHREELVLKFFAYGEARSNFSHSVKDFLNNYMERRQEDGRKANRPRREIFDATLDEALKQFPDGIVRGVRTGTTPLTLAEAALLGIRDVINSGGAFKSGPNPHVLNSAELKRLTTGATNSRTMLNGRIDYVADSIRDK